MSPTVNTILHRKLDKFTNLPSIPQVLFNIRKISEDPKTSATDLANCILSDHQLTSRILQVANSAYYGDFSRKILTVTHAIILMGFRAVRNIAISMAAYQAVNRLTKGSNFDAKVFWARSLASGIIAKFLASRLDKKKLAESAFIAGFLHDIGQPVLAGVFPKKYDEVSKLETDNPEIYKSERILLGVDHLEAGEHVARKWNLPDSLIEVIGGHHRIGLAATENSEQLLVDLVYLGDMLYPHVMAGVSPESQAFAIALEKTQNLLTITADDLADLIQECRSLVSEIASDLEIDIGSQLEQTELTEKDLTGIRQQLCNKEIQLAFLQNATSALQEAQSTDEILQVICEAVFRGLQLGRVIIFQYQEKWESYNGRVGFGVDSQQDIHALSFSAHKGLFKHIFGGGAAVSIVDQSHQAYSTLVSEEETDKLELSAFAAIPINLNDRPQFVIFADCVNRENPIDDESLHSIISLANQGAISLELRQLKEAASGTLDTASG